VSGIANSYPCRCIGLRHLSGLLSSSEIVLEADELDIEKYRKRILGIDPAISGKCKHDHAFTFLPELTNRGALGVFSAVLISYPHLYPHIDVAGIMFTGERGNVPMRGCDEFGKAGERQERQINYDFRGLGRRSVIPACTITLGEFDINVMLYKSSINL
jgi:hypothetical protein